jgi:hypothetical protein
MTSNDKLQTITLLEEFPIEENLSKLELLDFPVNIFVAANNIIEFNKIEEKIKKYPFVKTVGYWPILSIEDGYWFSAFTKREGIKRIMKELESTNTPFSVLWDAELPHLRKRLFLTEIPKFFSNRKLIRNFIAKPPKNVTLYVAENQNRGSIYSFFLKIFGITFTPDFEYNRVEMLYGQKHPNRLRELLKSGKANNNYYPTFGTTAEGINEDPYKESWMRISPEILEEQLNIAKEFGIKSIVIYRLGGLNEKYLNVIRSFIKS